MKKSNWKVFIAFGFLMGSMVGCASASAPTSTPASTDTPVPTSTPENTITPEPTATITPMPIAGIDEPIIVNDVNVQVLETKWEEPNVATGFQLKSGYISLMITIKLQSDETNSAAELMNKLSFREIAAVDDNDNESPIIFFNLPVSSLTGSEYAQLDLYFAVLETTVPKSIQFVDGQSIDLATLLPSQ